VATRYDHFFISLRNKIKKEKKDFHCGFKVCSGIYTVADRLRKEIVNNQYSNKKVK
jgi:hypothetical protein